MTLINRLFIAASAALIMVAIGRFVLKSWIFALAGAVVVALVLIVYLSRGQKSGPAK